MNTSKTYGAAIYTFGILPLVILTGCKSIDPAAVTNFSKSVTAVKTQTDETLNDVASLTRNASVAYAANQTKLKDEYFVTVPNADAISQWDDALSSVETYAQNLASLLSPDAVNNFDSAATNLANQFESTAKTLKSGALNSNPQTFALLSTAFTEVAGLIISAKEQATAVKVASATDEKIGSICTILADELGVSGVSPGLRKTIYETVWTPKLNTLNADFLTAKTPDEKLKISQVYADILSTRDVEDQILAGLRRSLLLLRDAHHTLAQGKPASIQADLNEVANEIQHTRTLYGQFSSISTVK